MSKVKSRSLAFALLAIIALSGGAISFAQTPAAPVRPQSANPAGAGEASAAAVDPNKYLIGPEDMLFVKVWREPDFTLPLLERDPQDIAQLEHLGRITARHAETLCRLAVCIRLLQRDELARGKLLDPVIADDVKELVGGWLYKHIMQRDVDYLPFVKEKRLGSGEGVCQ